MASARSEEARSRLAYRVHDQGAIQKEISCFAASLRDQETAMARCTMQCSVVIRSGWIVVRTYRIARTKALPSKADLRIRTNRRVTSTRPPKVPDYLPWRCRSGSRTELVALQHAAVEGRQGEDRHEGP
jgi:hypothetical protein